MRIITISLIAGVAAGALLGSGCCAFRSRTQVITVTTNPADADLQINGIHYRSPAQVPVQRDIPVVLQCSREGFEPQQRIIQTHLNGTAFLDGVGFFFFLWPGIGLLTPGSHSLDQTTVSIDLSQPYVPSTNKPVILQTPKGTK